MATRIIRIVVLIAVLGASLGVGWSGVAAADPPIRLAKKAILQSGADWLQAQQEKNGGFPDLSGEADPGVTSEAILALAALEAAGIDIELEEAVAYLQKVAPDNEELVAGSDAKVVLALVAAGADPRDVDGTDLVARVVDSWDEETGAYSENQLDNFLAIIALVATDEDVPELAIETLSDLQIEDGSWSFAGSTDPGTGDTIMTSFVIRALVATGHDDEDLIDRALDFLRAGQSEDGGFASGSGFPPDANTTGFVISALTLVGEKAKSGEWNNAAGALIAFQNDSGAFRYNAEAPEDDILATITALVALSGAGPYLF